MTTVADYTGRTIDLSMFTNVREQGETLLVQEIAGPDNFGSICTGVQKVAQRVVLRLFTIRGSLLHEIDEGCDFLTHMMAGRFRSVPDIFAAFSESRSDIMEQFISEESTDDPDEERLADLELVEVNLATEFLSMTVRVITLAGTSRSVIIPIPVIV